MGKHDMADHFDVGIHTTNPGNIEAIQQLGLLVNPPSKGFTEEGVWAYTAYGSVPIFISFNKPWSDEGVADFRVDLRGYGKVADLPSLVYRGAYVADDETGLWWEEGEEPYELAPFLDDDGFIALEDLLVPDSPAAYAAMAITGTAAILENIPPDKIELL